MQSRLRSVHKLENATLLRILHGFSFRFSSLSAQFFFSVVDPLNVALKDTFCFSVFYLILKTVLVSVFYSKPQRLDVYVNDNLVAPTNAQWNAANTDYTLKKPVYAGTEALLAHT